MKSPSLKLFCIPLSLHMVKRSEESVCLLQPRQLTAFSYRTVGTCRSDKSCTGTDPHVKTARCKRWKWNKLVWIITDNHGLFFFFKNEIFYDQGLMTRTFKYQFHKLTGRKMKKSIYSGFLYNHGAGIDMVMDKFHGFHHDYLVLPNISIIEMSWSRWKKGRKFDHGHHNYTENQRTKSF